MSALHLYRPSLSALILLIALALPATAMDFPEWVDNLLPDPGLGTTQDEVKCYSLPYGGIGFTSHVLTYYTLVCLWSGRAPWWPKHRLTSWKLDLCLGISSLIVSVGLSSFTLYRCRNGWPFILIATQKLLLSFSLGATTIHRAVDVRRITKYGRSSHIAYEMSPDPGDDDTSYPPKSLAEPNTKPKTQYSSTPMAWIVFYACGAVIGLVGDIALLVQIWPHRTRAMNIVTGVFGGLVLFVALLVILLVFVGGGSWFGSIFGGLFGAAVMAGIVAALYGDWLLAAVLAAREGARGWVGLPSSDIAVLYWTYFVFKRLPFFSF